MPPVHQPAQSLSVFDNATALVPIPLGVGVDDVISWAPNEHRGLQVFGGTGDGTTVLILGVIEQCRTRGWQVLIADGRGYEFSGLYGQSNVSYVGGVRVLNDPPYRDYLATLELAHQMLVARQTAAAMGRGGFAPLLLVLGELGALMHRLHHELDTDRIDRIHTIVKDFMAADAEFRCHVVVSPASGWGYRLPASWSTHCATVFLGRHPHPSCPAAAAETVKASFRPDAPKGRGVLVTIDRSAVKSTVFQSFFTYSPAAGSRPYTSEVIDSWEHFKQAVSEKTPPLHPQLVPN